MAKAWEDSTHRRSNTRMGLRSAQSVCRVFPPLSRCNATLSCCSARHLDCTMSTFGQCSETTGGQTAEASQREVKPMDASSGTARLTGRPEQPERKRKRDKESRVAVNRSRDVYYVRYKQTRAKARLQRDSSQWPCRSRRLV